MKTVNDIFDFYSGPAAVARILGCNPSTASEMKRRESIPVEYWPDLVIADLSGSVTMELLAEVMANAARSKRADPIEHEPAA